MMLILPWSKNKGAVTKERIKREGSLLGVWEKNVSPL